MLKFLKKIFVNSDRENIELIRKSKYFDEQYYLLENPKIKGDLASHYYYQGWKEGKSPSFDFSNNFYLKNYKDVADAAINPLIHYLKFGKAENRIIGKENGLTLKNVYEKVYGCVYFYKTYIYDTDIKRINIFFDSIDEKVEDLCELLKYVVKFCSDYKYCLRIVYFSADFEILKDILKRNNIELPADTIFLNLKSSNYLEVGLDEKYICTSWKTGRALLNTSSVNATIYYYLRSDIKNLSKEEYYQVSNICMNEHVIVMAKDKKDINCIKKCYLKFELGNNKLELKHANQLYCDFDKMFIVGIELLDEAFLSGILDCETWRVNVLESEKKINFHFETNVSIKRVNEISNDVDLIFVISYDKKEVFEEKPYINVWVEEKDVSLDNFILVTEYDYQKMLETKEFSISAIESDSKQFQRCISKLKDKR